MLLQVDARYIHSLASHLTAQGFPAARVGDDRLDVLFPAPPSLFAVAVELEDWLAQIGDAVVRVMSTASAPVCRQPAPGRPHV